MKGKPLWLWIRMFGFWHGIACWRTERFEIKESRQSPTNNIKRSIMKDGLIWWVVGFTSGFTVGCIVMWIQN